MPPRLLQTPEGKMTQFLSVISLTPLNPNYRENIAEWAAAIGSKGGFLVSIGFESEPSILTLTQEIWLAP
jgi:hypothetical protein